MDHAHSDYPLVLRRGQTVQATIISMFSYDAFYTISITNNVVTYVTPTIICIEYI